MDFRSRGWGIVRGGEGEGWCWLVLKAFYVRAMDCGNLNLVRYEILEKFLCMPIYYSSA